LGIEESPSEVCEPIDGVGSCGDDLTSLGEFVLGWTTCEAFEVHELHGLVWLRGRTVDEFEHRFEWADAGGFVRGFSVEHHEFLTERGKFVTELAEVVSSGLTEHAEEV
jgi:hypothetical protein